MIPFPARHFLDQPSPSRATHRRPRPAPGRRPSPLPLPSSHPAGALSTGTTRWPSRYTTSPRCACSPNPVPPSPARPVPSRPVPSLARVATRAQRVVTLPTQPGLLQPQGHIPPTPPVRLFFLLFLFWPPHPSAATLAIVPRIWRFSSSDRIDCTVARLILTPTPHDISPSHQTITPSHPLGLGRSASVPLPCPPPSHLDPFLGGFFWGPHPLDYGPFDPKSHPSAVDACGPDASPARWHEGGTMGV